MARESLEDQIGEISENNISRYGRNILVKAEHRSQAKLLTTFSPEEGDIVTSVTPHRSFNTARGVVFSRDLYEFDEKEILKRSPEEVLSVRKLKGKNGAILLTFYSPYLPDYVKIAKVNMSVKRFKQRPIQCYKCYEFGHVEGNCPPERPARCFICSGIHDLVSLCKRERCCFHCQGAHSPNWKECPSFLLEKEILEVAANEHVSLGVARRKVKPWKKKSYASAASPATNQYDSNTPVNRDTNKTPVIQTKASKTSVVQNEASIIPVVSTESEKAPATPDSAEGVRPKDSVPSKRKKSSISKRQLPASQLEIHEAPKDKHEIVSSAVEESSQSVAEETTPVIGHES